MLIKEKSSLNEAIVVIMTVAFCTTIGISTFWVTIPMGVLRWYFLEEPLPIVKTISTSMLSHS